MLDKRPRRVELAEDARYAWPLLVAATRAVGAAETVGQPAHLLPRLRALAAQMPAFGPVQRANKLAFAAEALYARGLIYTDKGELAKAKKALDRAFRLKPELAEKK